ncbi:NAD-dependent epimerase/dehydratase family protein [Nitrincola sp.]|uniref:NAD-dependent epimerase/dehydratase family protein n=1 Tax=Nitrincola sp. TaxID=1926584 RepID=UPI003A8FB2AE
MKKIRIGITSIGSGVGQSIVDSCRLSGLPMHITGYGNNPYAYGAFDCDDQKELPNIYQKEYIESLIHACHRDEIEILFPGLDDELLLLSENKKRFREIGTTIPVSSSEIIGYCRNKESMSNELNKYSNTFVKSYQASEIINREHHNLPFPLIAKPNSGCASRGIFIINSIDDLYKVNESHVIQEIAKPLKSDINYQAFENALEKRQIYQVSELSLQVIIGKGGNELGRFCSYNKLQNGVPIEIIPINSPDVWHNIDIIIPVLIKKGLYGPINFQGRITEDGLKIFEINARFTGITGLRALMGFNEVEAIILDMLDKQSKLPSKIEKIGLRQVQNRTINAKTNKFIKNALEQTSTHVKNTNGLTVLVTGANSYLGRAVLKKLIKTENVSEIIALVRDPSRFSKKIEPPLPSNISVMDISTLDNGQLNLGSIDVICHLASARPGNTNEQIAESLSFTQKIINMAIKFQVTGFINASTQAVYGTNYTKPWAEYMPASPETTYAQSKWASELMTNSLSEFNKQTFGTSLRFSQIIGASPIMRKAELPHLMIHKLMEGSNITVLGGQQKLDLVDIEDAAEAVIKLLKSSFEQWPKVLNIGSGNPIRVDELAKKCLQATFSHAHDNNLIHTKKSEEQKSFGMDISLAEKIIEWKPTKNIDHTLKSIKAYIENQHSPLKNNPNT